MRLFRKKKKETPRKAKPASIYYSPAAASEEAAVPRTPQERALADFAQESPLETPPTLRTPVRMRNGDLDGADLRDTLARADIDPEARRRLEALLDRLEAAERAAVQTPVKRQVSWDPATVERPPVVKDASWRSLQRAPSTPTTPSKHLLLAFGLDDAANSPTARGGGAATSSPRGPSRSRVCSPARRRRCRAVAAPRRAAPAARARRAPGQGHGSCHSSGMSHKKTAYGEDRLRGAAHGR